MEGNDFYVDISDNAPGLVQAAGIQSPGLTAAPAIAEQVADLLLKDGLELKAKRGFDPALRPSPKVRQMDIRELEEHIRREPSFGRMVCRCESVSEAEVVAAIRKGHTTLDGIKFATRAGMGRCQGGFCTYRVLAIIARETGLPAEAVTKRGPGSPVVLGRIGGDRGQDV